MKQRSLYLRCKNPNPIKIGKSGEGIAGKKKLK
jgi:hypothetical protein